jgi:lactate dehydrogenase-like 2-hydroxyacid dehydrogenase
VLARLPRLGIVCCTGSGYEKVDLAACAARGIGVTHGRAVNADSVADVALGLLIASVRGFTQGRALLASGAWSGNAARNMPLVRGLTGLRVGVYGLGEIGARIARRALACGCVIGYHGRAPHAGVDYAYFATLPALAEWADALVVSVRAETANRHAVDAAVLRALGPQGHVVNIARGSVIDERALIDALRDGTLGGAGLDVYEHEPEVPAELLALPNAVLTPHFGGYTLEAQAAMQALVLQNLEAFFAGRPPVTPVAARA